METPHGRLVALELKNFKSYMGEQTIVRPLPATPPPAACNALASDPSQ